MSSGTDRTTNNTSVIISVRPAATNSWARPAAYRSRSGPSANPIPGCTSRAVTAHRRPGCCWITATRRRSGPWGGPSCTTTPASTPGRSGTSGWPGRPAAARLRHDDQPVTRPSANTAVAASQPAAVRPRTGTTTSTANPTQPHPQPAAAVQAARLIAVNTGSDATASSTTCPPRNPKNHPTRSRRYSPNTLTP